MTKKQIQLLTNASYTRNQLDEKKVSKIASLLTRKDLREYIRLLKLYEKKQTVIASLPYLPKEPTQKKISETFPDKKIVYIVDPTLLAGIRITNNDIITDYNVKNMLDNISNHITHYDR